MIQYTENLYTEAVDSNMHRDSKIQMLPSDEFSGFKNTVWKQNGLNILLIVLKFISVITKSNFVSYFKFVKKPVFRIINDRASFYNYYRYNGYFTYDRASKFGAKIYKSFPTIYNLRRKLLTSRKNTFLLEPDDTSVIIWNIYLLLMVTINVIYVSTKMSFPEISNMYFANQDIVFEQLPTYSYLFEVVLKFNTCIYNRGNLISNRRQICINYLKDCNNIQYLEFIIDFLIIVPFFIGKQINVNYFDIFIVFKVFQLQQLTNNLFNRLELNIRQTAIFDLCRLVALIIIAAHFCGCIWHGIGQWGEWGYKSRTWMTEKGIEDDDWYHRYVTSFYWSVVTMTTIGYGDIYPVNLTEKVFIIIITIITTALFGYSVNSIGQILSDMQKSVIEYKNNMNSLKKYLKSRNVSKRIEIKFTRYFEYLWTRPSKEEFKFADLIPEQLQKEMIVDINMKVLQELPFFKSQFSKEVLRKLSLQLQEKTLQAGDQLIKANQKSNMMYIFVSGDLRGSVKLKRTADIERISKTQLISAQEFFTNRNYRLDYQSKEMTKVLQITRQDLFELFQEYPKDYLKLQQSISDIIFADNLALIQPPCRACNKMNHHIMDCRQLSYSISMVTGKPNKSKVILNFKRQVPSDRQPYKRDGFKMGSLINQGQLEESVIQYLINNEEFDQLNGFKESLQVKLRARKTYVHQLSNQSSGALKTFKYNSAKQLNNREMQESMKKMEAEVPEEMKLPGDIQNLHFNSSSMISQEEPQVLIKLPKIQELCPSSRVLTLDDSFMCGSNGSNQNNIFCDFDRMKEYSEFYPNSNYSSVIEDLMINQLKNNSNKRKSKRQNTLLDLLQKTRQKKMQSFRKIQLE